MNWLKQIFSRETMQIDLSEEMQQHLEEKIEVLVAQGMPRDKAVHAARRAFGNATLLEQRSREIWIWPLVESLWADIKFALRQLRKSPGITLIAVMALALGIGANTAVFTLTWAVILKSLPVPHPDKLVEYVMDNGEPTTIGLSGPEYASLRRKQKACTDLLAWVSDIAALQKDGASEQVPIQLLSGNAFHVLQMQPYLGNFFSERADSDVGAQGTPVVLSYGFWQEKFHGDAGALGQSFFVAHHSVTVVGVMPKAFEGLTANFHPAVYLPLSFADLLYGNDFLNSPGHFGLYVLGRLKPGVTLAAAKAEVMALEPSIRKEADPSGIYMNQFFKAFRLRAQNGRSGISWVKEVYARPLLVLEMLVAFLLILCCLNTALVMVARVSGRHQEYAVRSAMGASKYRLIRQILIETILLTIPGLIGGLLIGWTAARALVAMLGTMGSASSMDVQPNGTILGFNVAVSLLVAFAAGLWPAFHAAKTTPALDLKASGYSVAAKQMGGWVIVLQVAVCVSLVTSAVLLGGTLSSLLTEHSGFRAHGTALASVYLGDLKLKPAETDRIVGELLDSIRQKPGVRASGIADITPLAGWFGAASREFGIDAHGNIHSNPHILYIQVSPGYFDAIGTRLLTGESAAPTSKDSMSHCVLSQTLAAYFFPKENAVGRIVYASRFGQPDGTNFDPKNGCRVVGVAENARLVSLRIAAPSVVYNVMSPSLWAGSGTNLIVHARTDALAIAALHDAIKQIVPSMAKAQYQTLGQLEDRNLNRERMLTSLSGVFALLALLLTALGMYGLLMRNVVLRTREIGIRVALGAQRRQIVMAMAKHAMIEVGIGLLAGAAVTIFLTREIRQLLENSQPEPGWPFLISISVILLVAAIAIFFPARRAASVDPMQALRSE